MHTDFVLLIAVLLNFSGVCTECPPNSIYIDQMDKCLLFSDNAASFPNAEAICASYSGHLLSIHNAFENSLVAAYQEEAASMKKFLLIGLSREYLSSNWTWSDNTTVNYYKWAAGHPGSNSNCAFLSTEEQNWHSVDCMQANAFICELPKKTEENACRPDWKYFNYTNMCYYKGENKSFNQAEIYCRSYGGHLASVHDNIENAFIFELTYATSCYNGSSQFVEGTTVLGGLYDKSIAGVSEWLDGSPCDYCGELMCYESNDNRIVTMFSYPINCNDCGNAHGNWYIAPDDRTETKFPNFVCKAPAFQARSLHV